MKIKAFKGYRFNADVVGDAGACIAPPYDVIDPDQQEKLYKQNPFNIVRLIKGKQNEDDSETNNVYTRAADYLNDFIAKEGLKQDEQESIYVYAQDFEIDGQRFRRTGFIALGELEDYGDGIKPHEQTLAGPKADRLNLTRATKSQIGQIFMLFSDPEKKVDAVLAKAGSGEALLSHKDDDEVIHQLYAITDPGDIETVQTVMSDKNVFIADGHHRYETALNYYRETQNPAAAYQMMTFVNTHNEGLVVLPTHRLLKNLSDFSPAILVGQISEYFDIAHLKYGDMVEKKEQQEKMFKAMNLEYENGERSLGMYFNDGNYYVATLRDGTVMKELAPEKSHAWRQLDVAILHKLVLEKMLGIDEAALTAQTNVEYIKDFGPATQKAIDSVDSGESQGLFFMNKTRAEDVEAVALAGEKMPQKSTFFFPKIFSGLVVNKL